jgi:hypothetical protein
MNAKAAQDEEERRTCPTKIKQVDKHRLVSIRTEVAHAVYPGQYLMKLIPNRWSKRTGRIASRITRQRTQYDSARLPLRRDQTFSPFTFQIDLACCVFEQKMSA